MKVFPTCLFAPNDVHADLERRTISGGEALNGDEDTIATDGGGRVFLEIGDAYLDDPEAALVWRAMDAYLDGGVRAIIVPICDARHQPTMGSEGCSDISTGFDEEGIPEVGDANGAMASNAGLRSTTLTIAIEWLSRALVGGEWLSIDHSTMRWRCYRISEVVSQAGGYATVRIRPPLREAVSVGQPVDFANPRCTMRVEGGLPSPTQMGYVIAPTVRFVEDFSGNYD